MLLRFGKWLVVLALVVSTGGHWFALQSVAWLTMAVNFAQTDSLNVALRKTFDGKHPCKLCKAVREGRQSDQNEQKQPSLKVEFTKLEFCCQQELFMVLPPNTAIFSNPAFDFSASSRRESPPTPPPRLA